MIWKYILEFCENLFIGILAITLFNWLWSLETGHYNGNFFINTCFAIIGISIFNYFISKKNE